MGAVLTYQTQAAKGTDIAYDRRRLRALYRGDRDATIQAFRERFQGMSSSSTTSTGYDESSRNILVENELKPLVDQRIEAVPTSFEPQAEEGTPEDRVERFEAWATSTITPQGWDLYASTQQIVSDQELDGAAVCTMGRYDDDSVWLEVRDGAEIEAQHGNPQDPAEVTGWDISWSRLENGREVAYTETWTTTETILTSGSSELRRDAHGLGYLPVVVIPRTMEHGGILSQPVQCAV